MYRTSAHLLNKLLHSQQIGRSRVSNAKASTIADILVAVLFFVSTFSWLYHHKLEWISKWKPGQETDCMGDTGDGIWGESIKGNENICLL